MKSFRNRTIAPNQVVQVYKNLHRNEWSVRDAETGLVLAHTPNIVLSDVKLVVNEAGRQRVLSTKTKNVHAYVEGHYRPDLKSDEPILALGHISRVNYDPYKFDSFVEAHRKNAPIHEANYAELMPSMSVYISTKLEVSK